MAHCSCCEELGVISPNVCACYPEYCPRCLLCKLHCDCTDDATIVDDEFLRAVGRVNDPEDNPN